MSPRREALLAQAEKVLESQGLEEFSLGAVARAAGIRTPSLYKHFAGLADLEHALISRAFFHLAAALDDATTRETAGEPGGEPEPDLLAKFAQAYRAYAAAHPQLYRLMTERSLDRDLLEAGAEAAAMSALLKFFGESHASHDRARAAWAAAHGLVSLELAGRFPPGTDLDAAWAVYTSAFTR
ncbi:TetR/AcrR family transcriptional regulator [Leucobacter sp. HY1908]